MERAIAESVNTNCLVCNQITFNSQRAVLACTMLLGFVFEFIIRMRQPRSLTDGEARDLCCDVNSSAALSASNGSAHSFMNESDSSRLSGIG